MEYLIETIKTTLSKTKVEKLASIASDQTFSVLDLIDMSFNKDEQIGFRAAWILERVYSFHQQRFLPYTDSFLERLPAQQNLSALRHFTKILALMTKKNASPEIREVISAYDTEFLAEVVFAWLIDEKIPVAVKSHCLNILANLCQKHMWIKNELVETMEFLVSKESIAFFAKVKQIRKQLKIN